MDASRQLRVAMTLAALRDWTPEGGHFLIDQLEEYIETERKTSALALAILRSEIPQHKVGGGEGPDLGGYEPGDPKAWVLKEREE